MTVGARRDFDVIVIGAGMADFPAIMARKDAIVRKSVETEAFQRMLEEHQIPLIRGKARFLSPHEIQVNGDVLRAERFVIATGSVPAVPPIPGLADVGYV